MTGVQTCALPIYTWTLLGSTEAQRGADNVVSRRRQDLPLRPGAVEYGPGGAGNAWPQGKLQTGNLEAPQGTRSEAPRAILWLLKLIQKHISGISVSNVTHLDVRLNVVSETPE